MAIELRQSLKLSQQLVITPQLQQAIKLLQLSRMELVDLIQTEMLENPILEDAPQIEDEEVPAEMAKEMEVEAAPDKSHEEQLEVGNKDGDLKEPKEFDWENYLGTYNDYGEGGSARNFSIDDLPTYDNFVSKPSTLEEHLEWQLRMSPLSESDEELGLEIIGAIDENGYLTVPLSELAANCGHDEEDLAEVLTEIQGFDPPGVGARDLKECLLLQARLFKVDRPLLEEMIKDHLHLLERKDFNVLARKMKLPLKKIITLARIITEMEPKPGRPYGRTDTQYITPDVYVYKIGEEYAVVLNEEGLPRLRISNFYKNMVAKDGNGNGKGNGNGHQEGEAKGEAKGYVQDKLKSALWLIKSIHQRQRTLYRVSKCIVKFQKDFFDKGINFLKPMILKDVAEEIGMHESTVSRATNNKYMHTPQGIFELKYFFNSGVSVMSGSDVASETVKQKIKILVSGENVKNPLSDKEIVAMLKEANIDIARRTVAKYREMLGILPSSKRKQLY